MKDKFDINQIHTAIKEVEDNFNKIDEWIIPRDRFSFYLTHDYHPYFAAFPPELVKRLLLRYSKEGDILLDPFMGGGSAIIEAFIHKRNAIGIDISEFSKFIVKGKVTPFIINNDELKSILSQIDKDIINHKMKAYKNFNYPIPDVTNIDTWFSIESKYDLAIVLYHLKKVKNRKLRNFLTLAFSSIIRKVSNAKNAQQHLCRKKNKKIPQTLPLFRDKVKLITKQMKEYVNLLGELSEHKLPKLYAYDIRKMDEIIDAESVDIVITSPPYGTGSKYTNIYKLHFEWLVLEKPNIKECMDRSKNFRDDLKKGLIQIYKCLKKGKYLFLVYGDPSTHGLTKDAIADAISIGFRYEGLISCPIEKTLSKHHTKYRRFIPKDFILIFKK